MEIEILEGNFILAQVENFKGLNLEEDFVFTGKTDEEKSVLCREKDLPKKVIKCEKDWRGFRIKGPLDFSLVGILAKITGMLAQGKISIFALSTFNTDYIFVREVDFLKSLNILSEEYEIIGGENE